MKIHHLGLLPLMIVCVACSTYSRKECEAMNWQERGYRQAIEGEPQQSTGLAYYRKECGEEHDVYPDENQFDTGFKEGLKVFCTPYAAQNFGRSGNSYRGQCTAYDEPAFLKAYDEGKKVYYQVRIAQLESEVSGLKNTISSQDSTISSLRSQISHLESRLSSCR